MELYIDRESYVHSTQNTKFVSYYPRDCFSMQILITKLATFLLHQACPSAECNKKVVDNGNDTYRCEKCAKDYPNYKYRLLMSVSLFCVSQNLKPLFNYSASQ